jgi:hypothetical protein
MITPEDFGGNILEPRDVAAADSLLHAVFPRYKSSSARVASATTRGIGFFPCS